MNLIKNSISNSNSLCRNSSLDIIRILAMLYVIGVHVYDYYPISSTSIISIIILTVMYKNNLFFYMLSGYFNIDKKFDSKEDYKQFYISRLISILFPYILATFILSIRFIMKEGIGLSFSNLMKTFYTDFMATNSGKTLWFMYPLIGFIISTPIFSKAFTNMKNWELHIVFIIYVFWNIISIYFTSDFGIGFAYTGFVLNSWAGLYFIGYYVKKAINDSNIKYFLFLGVLGFIVSIAGQWIIPNNFHNALDLSVSHIFYSICIFIIINRNINIKNALFNKIISFIAKHTFTIYLAHYAILVDIGVHFAKSDNNLINYVLVSAATFIITFIFAVVIDEFLLFPCQKVLKKMLNVD